MTGRLSRFLRPKTVAYVGGSQIAGPIRAASRAGYEGQIWVVNPVRDEIEGFTCHSAVKALPSAPDAAVVGLSAERAIAAVAELSATDAGGAVVMSSGFAELGTDEGRDRQARLKAAAGTMPLLGPNCMGLINQFSGAAVWGDDNHIERQEGPAAALISQSGALLIGITNVEQAFPLGYAASVGNQAVTTIAELIEEIVEDDRIRAVGLYLEGMEDGEALGSACLKALKRGVPVVALKGGDGSEGSRVSLSHTASMVVERDIWEAFCRRFGIVEVSSPKALVESLKLLTVAGLPKGNRLSILSYSGGLNGLAAARSPAIGLTLPMPTEENLAFLRDRLPDTVALNNPLDLNIPFSASDGGISMRDTSGIAETIIAFAGEVSDQVVFFIDVPRPGAAGLDKVWENSLEALIEVRDKLQIPVCVAGIMPEGLAAGFRCHMQQNGVAALLGYADAMEALSVSAGLSAARERLHAATAPPPLYARAGPAKVSMVDEANAKVALGRYGLVTPAFATAAPNETADAAEALGFPVAVKVLSTTIAHKAKVGGVHLNLTESGSVRDACNRMTTDVANAEGGHAVERVLIEKMVEGGDKELILGVKRHPAVGLALMLGMGGRQAEAIAKFTTLLLPLQDGATAAAMEEMGLSRHKAAHELKKACEAVAAYAHAHERELVTLDVNPLILTEDGRAVAADALIVLGENP